MQILFGWGGLCFVMVLVLALVYICNYASRRYIDQLKKNQREPYPDYYYILTERRSDYVWSAGSVLCLFYCGAILFTQAGQYETTTIFKFVVWTLFMLWTGILYLAYCSIRREGDPEPEGDEY